MKVVDDFLARRRAQKLRVASSMSLADVAKLVDELVAMGAVAIEPLSECLSHGEARGPALEALDRLVSEATFTTVSAAPALVEPDGRLRRRRAFWRRASGSIRVAC